MSDSTNIETYNKFISLIARRYDKLLWSKLPTRTREIFHTYKNIEKWLVKASDREKMFFLQDLGFTTSIVVFPDGNAGISDIPELSDYFFTIENRIKSVERQMEKDMFAITVREMAPIFYNMAQNSNSTYYARKIDFKALAEANEAAASGSYKSATEYQKSKEVRESILKFVSNILAEFNSQSQKELSLPAVTILLHLREYVEVGTKLDSILSLFKGSLGERRIYQYLALLKKKGLIISTGKKKMAVYTLSASGMLYINDYINNILSQ